MERLGKSEGHDCCPRCGGPVNCGMDAGPSPCWCCTLPPVMVVPPADCTTRCYCRACLRELIDTEAQQWRARDVQTP